MHILENRDKTAVDLNYSIKIRRHGYTLFHNPVITKNHIVPIRTQNKGWTKLSCLRNTSFLQSVKYDEMMKNYDMAINFTWTIKELVDSPESFHHKLHIMKKRISDLCNNFSWHWVIEWQERGVPHIHGVVFAECQTSSHYAKVQNMLKFGFCDLFPGSLSVGQHSTLITNALGWAKYTAKHAARGMNHYQRSMKNVPPDWKNNTGRVWGKSLNFIRFIELQLEIPAQVFFNIRRSINKLAISIASTKKEKRYIAKRLNSYFNHNKSIKSIYECPKYGNSNRFLMSSHKSISDWLDKNHLQKLIDYHIEAHLSLIRSNFTDTKPLLAL